MTFLKKIVFFTNILAALSLVAGGWSIYLNPAQWWFLSFFGLLYPVFLFINIFFFFFWMVARLKYALLPLIAIILTFPVLKSYFAFQHGIKTKTAGTTDYKIMSYNVRNFDVYHWSKEKNALDDIIQMVKKENPAIVCFQEFYEADTGKYQTIHLLKEEAGLANFYFEKTYKSKSLRSWGTAIFSRFPIINHGTVEFTNHTQNSCSFADIQLDSAVVRVFNIHLQSIYLSNKDYQYLEDISENQDVQVGPTKVIASKLKRAFILRSEQALDIEAQIVKSPYPVIVCGDFNDTPASFAYHTLSTHLQDAFLQAGWGIGPTYSGFFQAYRIDYIFAGEKFSVKNYNTICANYSDHYPVTCSVAIKK